MGTWTMVPAGMDPFTRSHSGEVALRFIHDRCSAGAVQEFLEATEQICPAQPKEARDQLGDHRGKGGGNAEGKGQPYG